MITGDLKSKVHRVWDAFWWGYFTPIERTAIMFDSVGQKMLPFLRGLGGDGSTCSEHMKDARSTIPNLAMLSRVVDLIDDIPMKMSW
ncbi:hypothetical protein AU190_09755 [Mycolicibacterium acapulense]|nr:hypothetical protein AU189_14655 [Mycolicibacterium acapulense]KUI06261.1 hypothetical protein AU190_09755 [Mycolicibacterium acapulense]